MRTFKDFIVNESINWAVDIDNMEIKKDSSHYSLVYLNLEKVMKNVNTDPRTGTGLDITKADGGKNAKSFRLSRVRSYIASKGYLDPSTIVYNETNNFIEFEDGRHRAFVTYQMGEKIIPFFVPNRQKNYFLNNYR